MTLQTDSQKWFEDFEKWTTAGTNEKILSLLETTTSPTKLHDDLGNGPLHYVAKTSNKSLMVHLLSIGCDVDLQNRKRESALVIAILCHNLEMIEILLDAGADHASVNFYGKFGPLHFAAERGYPEVVSLLLKSGADVEAVNVGQRTALHTAIATVYEDSFTDRLATIRALVEAGSDVNARDDTDDTPLHSAIAYDRSADVVNLLLDAGADVHVEDRNGYPALQRAIERNNLQSAKLLVRVTNVNWRDRAGRTFLHLAAAKARPDVVRLLLTAGGASVDVRENGDDFDPLCYGLKVRGERIGELLASRYERRDDHDNDELIELLFPETPNDQLECIKLLLEHGTSINRPNKRALTALHVAITNYQHSKVVQYLLSSGASFKPEHPIVREAMRRGNGSRVPYLLIKHSLLIQALKNPKKIKNLRCLVELESVNARLLEMHAEACKSELESMKLSWIYGSVSFFSILEDTDIGGCVRDEHFDTAFVKQFAAKKFPIYSDVLVDRFARLMDKRKAERVNADERKKSCAVM